MYIPIYDMIYKKHFFESFLMFIYFLREREGRERMLMSRGRAEREADTESEAGSRLWAVSTEPDSGLELTNHEIMIWAEVGCLNNWATQVPLQETYLSKMLTVIISGGWTYRRHYLWTLYISVNFKNFLWLVIRKKYFKEDKIFRQ